MNGVDARVELLWELDRLGETDVLAREAPRSKTIYNYLNLGIKSPEREQYLRLTTELLVRLGVWWSTAAYSRMPVMTPWCVRDRTCRYDQGPESWGSPRSDGYMRDDNSIIKKLPLSVQIVAPTGHPFNNRKPWRGFTACHIWRELPGGTVAGIDPWLYSLHAQLGLVTDMACAAIGPSRITRSRNPAAHQRRDISQPSCGAQSGEHRKSRVGDTAFPARRASAAN